MKVKANLFRILGVLAVVLVALFGVDLRTADTQTTAPSYYKVEDLGTLGGSHSWASAINDSGQVVGSSYLAGDQNHHAFLYMDAKMTDLGTLGGTSSRANGINESGQVVGWSDNSSGQRRAFLYDGANGMKDLNDSIPADLGWSIYEAGGINTDGQIAASSWGNTQPDTDIVCDYWSGAGPAVGAALVLSPTTTGDYEVQELGNLGGYYSRATSINDSSKVVGFSYAAPCGGGQPFFYDESADPQMQGLSMREATGLNNSGKVVGYREEWINWSCVDVGSGLDCWRAVLYDSATKQMQYLGDLRGPYPSGPRGVFGSVASGINDSGDVVGRSGIQDGTYGGDVHAFLKESGQPMIDLNTLIPADSGWTISSATAINNDGKIAATGYKDGVGTHALLLTPTSSDTPPPADDTEAPSPPTITSPQNNTYDTDGSFSVSGSAEAGSTVELFEGTSSKGTAKASSSGAWSIALSGLSEGAHTYTAKATDAAGNTSSATDSITVTVDTTAPTVSKEYPASSATGVGRNTGVTAQFSEDVDGTTLKVDTFMLGKGKLSGSQLTSATRIASQTSVSYEPTAQTATLDPYGSTTSTLAKCQWYTAKLTSKVKDKAGNPAIQKRWQFKTLC
jgi:probable HAF family extracellular repeat protein